MAKRILPTKNEITQTPMLIVGKENFEKELNKRIQSGEEIYSRQILTRQQFDQAKQDFYNWDDFNSELLKQSFNIPNNEYKSDYDRVNNSGIYFGGPSSPAEELKEFIDDVKNKVNSVRQLVAKLPLIKTEMHEVKQKTVDNYDQVSNNNIFIVHGHNNEVKINVARTLEKLGLNPIILHEQSNAGKTVIEKFEEHSNVSFAIVLLTDDDLGKSKKDDKLNSRARQNVILELGYFIGKLGRNRVCPLYSKGVELPSDLYGLLYLELDQSEYWKINLAKELKTAGYDIDVNKII